MTLTDLASVLESGGPWGIIAVLILSIGFLVRYIGKLVDDRDKRECERNAQLLKLLEDRIEADVKHEQAFKNMAKAFERVADKL